MEEFLPSSWTVYHTHNGPCPYRAVGQWDNLTFYADQLPIETYETLLGKGFRRSGTSIYHPACENCRLCIPLRVNVPSFQPSRSQKRTQRKNQDLRIEHVPVVFREDVFELYRRYQEHWHQRGNPTSREEFVEFLIDSPVPSEMILFWLEDKLLGVSWIDRLEDSTSAVYFAFDPNAQHRRLGIFSLLHEIEYAQHCKRQWHYLGYWVPDSKKMQYKADFRPSEVLLHQTWTPLTEELRHEC